MSDRSIWKTFSWEENEDDIKNDIIQEDDVATLDEYVGKTDEFFQRLDVMTTFIEEVHRISHQKDISLIRAFWIVNIVYRTYYKKSRLKTMDVFYQMNSAYLLKQRKIKLLRSGE